MAAALEKLEEFIIENGFAETRVSPTLRYADIIFFELVSERGLGTYFELISIEEEKENR